MVNDDPKNKHLTPSDNDDDSNANDHRMELSNAAATIDPSVVTSRIYQSASLQQPASLPLTPGKGDSANDDTVDQPHFPKLSALQATGNKVEYRRVRCPPHRYTPLREHWEQILTPLVEFLKLQVSRMYP